MNRKYIFTFFVISIFTLFTIMVAASDDALSQVPTECPVSNFSAVFDIADVEFGLSYAAESVSREELLTQHIDHIKCKLKRYDESSNYFEKIGISYEIRDYISENNLDTTSGDLFELNRINEEHISALLGMEEEYDIFLKENAETFVSKCNELTKLDDYQSIKNLCEEAEFLFFNIDVSDSRVQDAINIYETKMKQLAVMEENANSFIEAVNALVDVREGQDAEEIVSHMLHANSKLVGVDPAIGGVNESIIILKDVMQEYDSWVSSYNSELSLVNKTVGCLMNHKGEESFITFIINAIK